MDPRTEESSLPARLSRHQPTPTPTLTKNPSVLSTRSTTSPRTTRTCLGGSHRRTESSSQILVARSSHQIRNLHSTLPLLSRSPPPKTKSTRYPGRKPRQTRRDRETRRSSHVVVGHRPGDEVKWTNCDLAKVIITEKDLKATEVVDYPMSSVTMSKHLNHGVGERGKEVLFDSLEDKELISLQQLFSVQPPRRS